MNVLVVARYHLFQVEGVEEKGVHQGKDPPLTGKGKVSIQHPRLVFSSEHLMQIHVEKCPARGHLEGSRLGNFFHEASPDPGILGQKEALLSGRLGEGGQIAGRFSEDAKQVTGHGLALQNIVGKVGPIENPAEPDNALELLEPTATGRRDHSVLSLFVQSADELQGYL